MSTPDLPGAEGGATPRPAAPRAASLLQVAGAVFWSFFGVRKATDMRSDAATIRPMQVVIVGVVLAALIVVALLGVVRLILNSAGS